MLENFFLYGTIPANAETGTYNLSLVLVSYIVASFGAYAGLTLAVELFNAQTTKSKRILHWLGAFTLGSCIWLMHFIGMLAYEMQMDVGYNPWLTLLSMLIAAIFAYFVLHLTQVKELTSRRLVVSAVLLGFGISAMHYTGMAAMQMQAALRYIPLPFFISVAIAIMASGAALWIVFTLGQSSGRWQIVWRIIAALVMGAAICGMHYTGMVAAVFIPFADCCSHANHDSDLLVPAVFFFTTILIGILAFATWASSLLNYFDNISSNK
jgi:NO-binding membrane sensor protein with MHYT domain